LPRSVVSLGGRFGYTDQAETPNTQITVFDYGETQLIFEVRGLKSDDVRGVRVGNVVHLEGGTLVTGSKDESVKFLPRGGDAPVAYAAPRAGEQATGSRHYANFIAAVRSRKWSDLNA